MRTAPGSSLTGAARDGYVETILGRRRPINGIKNTTGRNLNLAERTAVNAVIQGSAADLIKRAMLAVDRRMRREGLAGRMLLQIHDELVFEAPESEVDRVVSLARETMESVAELGVPLKVDVGIGANWDEV